MNRDWAIDAIDEEKAMNGDQARIERLQGELRDARNTIGILRDAAGQYEASVRDLRRLLNMSDTTRKQAVALIGRIAHETDAWIAGEFNGHARLLIERVHGLVDKWPQLQARQRFGADGKPFYSPTDEEWRNQFPGINDYMRGPAKIKVGHPGGAGSDPGMERAHFLLNRDAARAYKYGLAAIDDESIDDVVEQIAGINRQLTTVFAGLREQRHETQKIDPCVEQIRLVGDKLQGVSDGYMHTQQEMAQLGRRVEDHATFVAREHETWEQRIAGMEEKAKGDRNLAISKHEGVSATLKALHDHMKRIELRLEEKTDADRLIVARQDERLDIHAGRMNKIESQFHP